MEVRLIDDIPKSATLQPGELTLAAFRDEVARYGVSGVEPVLPDLKLALPPGMPGDWQGAPSEAIPDVWHSSEEAASIPDLWCLKSAHVFGGTITSRPSKGYHREGQLALTR